MSDPQHVMALLTRCVDLPPSERMTFARRESAGDDELYEAVVRLLSVYEQGTDYLESSTQRAEGSEAPPDDPAEIDAYSIREKLGEGGFGAVYLAQQEEPIQRSVAVKLLKRGMDSDAVLARFDAERQALAQMDHPNVATVYDAGVAVDGRPYFVMQYVPGSSITEYADEVHLSTNERLRLFQNVCDGVQHAHQKGIIHRDIKPDNVLVTSAADEHVPVVIDFGIAKATESRLAGATTFTQRGSIIGTPEYMSPEQADLTNNDIDTRSDVYSLGVLLYELLVGGLPIPADELRQHGYGEMLRVIQEVDPPKPSTRASTSISNLNGAERRSAETRSLSRELRGDLDWIVMKALEKDRDRRYASPGEFSADIDRYLSFDPVHAGPPSARYRLKKFVRKNRTSVVAACALVLAITGGMLTSLWFWFQAEEARKESELDKKAALTDRDLATAAADRERRAKEEAISAGRLAKEREEEAQAARAREAERVEELKQVAKFQEDQLSEIDLELTGLRLRQALIDAVVSPVNSGNADDEPAAGVEAMLVGVDFAGIARGILERNVLERARESLSLGFEDQPLVKAQLYQALASTAQSLGLFELALQPQREALSIRQQRLGPDHPATLESVHNMAALLFERGELAEAEPLFEEALEARRRVLGNDHRETLEAVNSMGLIRQNQGKLTEAESYYSEGLEGRRRVLGNDDPDTLQSVHNMASMLSDLGKNKEAEALHREALEGFRRVLGPEHRSTLMCLTSLGRLLQALGRYSEAQQCLEESLRLRRRVLGNDHPETLGSINSIGMLFRHQGKLAEAQTFVEEVLAASRRLLGADHPHTLATINNMGSLLQSQGKHTEARSYYQEALVSQRRLLGNDHRDTLTTLSNLGFAIAMQGKFAEAEPYFEEALTSRRRVFGNDHPDTLMSVSNMGGLLQAQGRLAEAEVFVGEALATARRVLGNEHPNTLSTINNMGMLLKSQGKLTEAEPFYVESLDASRRLLGNDHPDTLVSVYNMGHLLRDQKRFDDAKGYFEEAIDGCRRVLGNEHPTTLKSIASMGLILQAQSRFDEARPFFEEALAGKRRALGNDHPDTQLSVHQMGHLLQLQGELAAARTYFAEALESSRRLLGNDHPETWLALHNVAYVLEGLGHYDDAKSKYAEALDANRNAVGNDHPNTQRLVTAMGRVLRAQGKFADARPYYEESLEVHRRLRGAEHPKTLAASDQLGALLRDQGQLHEAAALGSNVVAVAKRVLGARHAKVAGFLVSHGRTLLLLERHDQAAAELEEAHDIFVDAFGAEDGRSLEAVRHLISCYTQWHETEPEAGHDERAAEWQSKATAVQQQ